MTDYVMYIFVDVGLNMGKGKTASQVGHVVGLITEEIIRNAYENPTAENLEDYANYKKWVAGNKFKKIVLRATKDEMQNLISTEKKARYIIDSGLTQIEPNSLTVVGFFPRNDYGDQFKNFKLLN